MSHGETFNFWQMNSRSCSEEISSQSSLDDVESDPNLSCGGGSDHHMTPTNYPSVQSSATSIPLSVTSERVRAAAQQQITFQ